jgi:hypothetical protein
LEQKGVSSFANVFDPQSLNQDPEMETCLGRLETPQIKGFGSSSGDVNMFESDVSPRLEKHLDIMDVKVGKMLSTGDDAAISFAGLGVTKPSNAHSWLEKEMPLPDHDPPRNFELYILEVIFGHTQQW